MQISWLTAAALVLASYLLGAVPFGVLVAKMFDRGIDLRATGSGNIGATNVARTLGKWPGILTLLLDASKGAAAVLAAKALAPPGDLVLPAAAAGAAFLGHLFPVYLGFRGGKGVATALGVVLAFSPAAACILFLLFASVFAATRYVSLGSLVAGAGLMPAMMLLGAPPPLLALSAGIGVMVFWTHRENIRRLVAGQERKFGR
ncbi:MAG TPA: glycerol-3-phosphate 1-O-acyltransferase PlsY [Candidatus Deferrimicrobiaceae bacterium]